MLSRFQSRDIVRRYLAHEMKAKLNAPLDFTKVFHSVRGHLKKLE